MKVHEYQAKALFAQYHLPVDKSVLCRTVNEAVSAYQSLGSERAVVKAQVHTGGRGKAGGVKVAKGEEQLREYASQILGMDIKGFTVDRILVGEAIDPLIGMPDYLAREAAFCLFDDKALVKQAVPVFQNLYRLFKEKDASLAEINPLVVTKSGEVKAIDAKMTFDNNALYRHPDVFELFEPTAEERKEQDAKDKGFSYVNLGGEIGCMVNGAGLAMATMDMIKLYGGNPANFLDIGGSSNPTKIVEAMKLLLSDSHVRVVLINIFGGITRCDDVAKGLIEAFKMLDTDMPIVIRLTGTNEAEGRELLKGTKFHVAKTMSEAGKKAVELAQQCMNK